MTDSSLFSFHRPRVSTSGLTSILIVTLLVFGANVFCDELPEVVVDAFKKKYPDAEFDQWEDWEVDKNGFWEVQFKLDGKEFRADYTEEGLWVETERSIEYDELPDKVKRAIKIEFGDDDIEEIEEVDHSSRGRFFDVEFKRPGENQDIEYDLYGKRVGTFATMVEGLNAPVGPFATQQTAEDLSKIDLFLEFGYNLIIIFIYSWAIYYRRHHDHKMLFLLLGFNLFLFPIFLLSSSMITAGFGFTIFALLALVRLRSDTFSKTEVAYLLGAVSLTFINAMLPARAETVSAIVVLLTAYFGDHPRVWRDAYKTTNLRYRTKDTTLMLNQDLLRERVAQEFEIEVNDIEIERVDKNEVRLVLMYRDLPEIREARRAEAKARRRRRRRRKES